MGESAKPVKKRKTPPVPKARTKIPEKSVKKTVVKKVTMKDQGCQTSPGFVKASKAAKKAKIKKQDPSNPEMEEFVKKSVSAAKKATAAQKSPKKTPKKSPVKKANGTENV